MEKAIVTLSFDDGRKDTYDCFKEILFPLGIPATVNIPTGYIEMSIDEVSEIGYNGLMTKNELDWINSSNLFEIAAHGYMHSNTHDDIQLGVKKLMEWYGDINREGLGFASPHSDLSSEEIKKDYNFYRRNGIVYVRTSKKRKNSKLRRLVDIISKNLKIPGLVKFLYYDTLNDIPNKIDTDSSYVYYGTGIGKKLSLCQVKSLVRYAEKSNKWIILVFHGIDTKNSEEYQRDYYCWDKAKFIKLCKWLNSERKKNRIIIKNGIDVVKFS